MVTLVDVTRALAAVLGPSIGEYRHRTNAALNRKALSVGANSEAGYDPVGLEVVVERYPVDSSTPFLGDGVRVHREWPVTLKAWDDTADLAGAVNKLMVAFPQLGSPIYVPESDDTIATAQVRIPVEFHLEGADG